LEGDASGGVGPGNTKQAHLSLREAIEAAAAKLGQVPIGTQIGHFA
jgi:ribosomal protein S5